MSTLKRKLASQANGRKSKGPVTAAGKQISSRNSIRHGMLSNTCTLPGEAHDRFCQILENFTAEYQPVTETEFALVESLAVARWRQWRLWGVENAAIATGIRKVDSAALPGDPPMDLPTKVEQAFRTLADESSSLHLLQRYQSFSYRVIVKSGRALREIAEARREMKNTQRQTNLDIDIPESNRELTDPKTSPDTDTGSLTTDNERDTNLTS